MSNRNKLHVEEGFVLLWFIITIGVMIPLLAVVVDLGLLRIKTLELEGAARAASYAAILQRVESPTFQGQNVDRTLFGWLASKRAALFSLRNSPLEKQGAYFSFGNDDVNAILDPWESASSSIPGVDYGSNIGRYENFKIQFDHGTYLAGNDDYIHPTFKSVSGIRRPHGVPSFAISNAIRVKITLSNLRTHFAGMLGINKHTQITRTSVALERDLRNYECFAPLAIPLCELFLDYGEKVEGLISDTDAEDLYQSSEMRPMNQCGRELTFTEVKWFQDPSASNAIVRRDRSDGLLRSDLYSRPPTSEVPGVTMPDGSKQSVQIANWRALPIRGYLGQFETALLLSPYWNHKLPVDFSHPNNSITDEEMAEVFYGLAHPHEGQECLGETLFGARFEPLLEYSDGSIVDNLEFKTFLAAFISGQFPDPYPRFPPVPFRTAFGEVGGSSIPSKNFPYLRSVRSELRTCPAEVGEPDQLSDLAVPAPGELSTRLYPMGNLSPHKSDPWLDEWSDSPQNVWTNPLCHSDLLPRNDPDMNVLPVRVALIVPHHDFEADDPDTHESPYQYCDFGRRLVTGNSASGVKFPRYTTPLPETKPRIVGSVMAHVFDFNFDTLTDPVPGDRNPMMVRTDDAPGCSYYVDDATETGGVGCASEWQSPPNPALAYFPATRYSYCGTALGTSPLTPNPFKPDSPPGPPKCLDQYPERYPIGIAKPPLGGLQGGYDDGLGNPAIQSRFDWRIVTQHCLPGDQLSLASYPPKCPTGVTSYNGENNNCWEIRNRAPGIGCGGIRGRLQCSQEIVSDSLLHFEDELTDAVQIPTFAPEGLLLPLGNPSE